MVWRWRQNFRPPVGTCHSGKPGRPCHCAGRVVFFGGNPLSGLKGSQVWGSAPILRCHPPFHGSPVGSPSPSSPLSHNPDLLRSHPRGNYIHGPCDNSWELGHVSLLRFHALKGRDVTGSLSDVQPLRPELDIPVHFPLCESSLHASCNGMLWCTAVLVNQSLL